MLINWFVFDDQSLDDVEIEITANGGFPCSLFEGFQDALRELLQPFLAELIELLNRVYVGTRICQDC